MIDIGQERKAPRGRPKKKPDYDREKEIDDLVWEAVNLYSVPYDDRVWRDPDAPSIKTVATKMGISRIKVRKLLITGKYYSTESTREIQRLIDIGYSIEEICVHTGLSFAGVNSLCPYQKGAYNLKEMTLGAQNAKQFRKRKEACERLHSDEKNLWNTIEAFENFSFKMDNRLIKYTIDSNSICIKEKKFSREEVEKAYHLFKENNDHQYSKELNAIFLRFGR